MQTTMAKETDKQLREAVLQQLEWEPEIQSQDISVNAKEGVVTLTGFVPSYAAKVAAEKAAKSVYRVKAVANDIEVKSITRTDPEIARDVIEAMKLDLRVPDDRLKAGISDGFVTLAGCGKSLFGTYNGLTKSRKSLKLQAGYALENEVFTKILTFSAPC